MFLVIKILFCDTDLCIYINVHCILCQAFFLSRGVKLQNTLQGEILCWCQHEGNDPEILDNSSRERLCGES